MSTPIHGLPPSNVVPLETNREHAPAPAPDPTAPALSFADLLDVINPLQHIPLVSTLYQKLTGDTIDSGPRMLGGALFGAITGSFIPSLATAAFNTVIKEASGKDAGEHVAALFESDPAAQAPIQVVSPTVPSAVNPAVAQAPAATDYHLFANAPAPAPLPPTPMGDDAREWDGENIQLAIDRYQAGRQAPALRRPNIQVQG